MAAFDPNHPRLSWGHLLFADDSAIALRHTHHVLLVRDPYDWVLARARFFLSDTFDGSLEHLKRGNVAVDEVLNMMILGIHDKVPTMQEIFLHNALGWLGTKVRLIQFEQLIDCLNDIQSKRAERFFEQLLSHCGIDAMPVDWRQRVTIGADRNQRHRQRKSCGSATCHSI